MKKKHLFSIIIIFVSSIFLFLYFFDWNKSQKKFVFLIKKKELILSFLVGKISYYVDFDFEIVNESEFVLENRKVKYQNFYNPYMKYMFNRYYLEQNDKNVYLINMKGDLFYFSKNSIFQKKNIKFKRIKTNLKRLIGKEYIKDVSRVIKEILLIDQNIYISYIYNNDGCYSNGLLKGDLNNEEILFSPFVKLEECKNRYNLNQGGNIKEFKNKEILFTVGDYEFDVSPDPSTNEPQNIDSLYGKILSVNLETKEIKIISMGHRNPQGLYYDKKENIIFSTEHGPQGGDEINVNTNPTDKDIKNYGWAISSYGEHYGYPLNFSEKVKKDKDLLVDAPEYKFAPLNKSHIDFGFEEPIKYFTPSIGITEILKVKNFTNDDHKLVVASMGFNKEEDDMTIHILQFDKFFKETNYEKIYIGKRIRDIIDLNNGQILMSLEHDGSLGLLENIY